MWSAEERGMSAPLPSPPPRAVNQARQERQRLQARCVSHPHDVNAWIKLAQAWLRVAAPKPARDALETALRLDPQRPSAQARLGALLVDMGLTADAEERFNAALAMRPDLPLAWIGLARIRFRRRDLEGAEKLLKPLLAHLHEQPEALALYTEILQRSGRTAEALPLLQDALARPLPAQARSLLLFRQGNLCDALDRRDEAMASWSAANALSGHHFFPALHAKGIEGLLSRYTPGRVLARARNRNPLPVFIVGMPRSGTSLLEQMLDCHPQLQGIGEREDIRRIAVQIPEQLGYQPPYYRRLRRVNEDVLTGLSEAHIAHLQGLIAAPSVTRVIDKMPHNFQHLGLIGQLFPGARVLNCVRDPLDTCFSCYRQRFGMGLGYSADLRWLGHFYNGYVQMMIRWWQVQPTPIMDVAYEDLVQHPEAVLRQVLAFLDVPWDPACLQFFANRRDVGTASYAQVQRPLYTTSIGKSRRYLAHLQPLLEALDPALHPADVHQRAVPLGGCAPKSARSP